MMDINEVVKQIPFWNNLVDEEKAQLLGGCYFTHLQKRFLYLWNDRCMPWNDLCTRRLYQSLYHK